MSWKWLGGFVVVAVAAVACTPAPTPAPAPPAPTKQAQQQDLAALKKAAAIADCPAAPAAKGEAVKEGLPDVTLGCLGGGPDVRLPDLAAQLKKPVVLNIWAQWCPPCRTEAKFFQQLHARAAAKVAVVGIDHADPRPDLALELAKVLGLRYPQLVDAENELRGPFGLAVGLPATVFVAANGKVEHIAHVPYKTQAALDADVAKYLGVQP
ncbi:TlpA family protein disulfide reductase [Tenggerimyces flavus]|uniref:TlpA family protein disulfide reductase n=1 Tax=Tenggerimyces flavus TaxID=1708749 RepID=A0ABV7YBR3_9ACTN|nr:TlpA disulfide reductase family protein [Tenggerimyces flavus]MBM7783492.1 thiol-disulfide isomerase/thioredoxin [Tenggerimyces flavus]